MGREGGREGERERGRKEGGRRAGRGAAGGGRWGRVCCGAGAGRAGFARAQDGDCQERQGPNGVVSRISQSRSRLHVPCCGVGYCIGGICCDWIRQDVGMCCMRYASRTTLTANGFLPGPASPALPPARPPARSTAPRCCPCCEPSPYAPLRVGVPGGALAALGALAAAQLSAHVCSERRQRVRQRCLCYEGCRQVLGMFRTINLCCCLPPHLLRHCGGGGHVQAAPLPAHRHHRQHLHLLPRG